jgi:hypothetical protein
MRIPLRNRKIWSLGRGKANQVTQAIMELYFLRPKHVTVYGVDFYTSQQPYSPDSQGIEMYSHRFLEKSRTTLWSHHNQLHQKQIALEIQRRKGFFAGDDRYKALIETPDRAFLEHFTSWNVK